MTLSRFMVNTPSGCWKLFDVGGEIGLEYHDEDFGQTLAVAGMKSGPYLMIPLLGPSNPRDLLGQVVDFAFDPLTFLAPERMRGWRGRRSTRSIAATETAKSSKHCRKARSTSTAPYAMPPGRIGQHEIRNDVHSQTKHLRE